MAVSMTGAFSNVDRYRRALATMGWIAGSDQDSEGSDRDEADAIQQSVDGSEGTQGILLRLSGVPSVFLRMADGPISDPLAIYQSLVLGWNLTAPLTALPAPRDLLRLYNTTYKPDREAIVRGDESPVAELRLSDVLDVADVQRTTGQLLLLMPDTWRSRTYQDFLKSPTGRGRMTVDDALIRDLRAWRLALVRNLYERYTDGDLRDLDDQTQRLRDLDDKAQRILDEIIFVRFCEDRGLTTISPLFDAVTGSRGTPFLDNFNDIVGAYEALFDTSIFDPVLTTDAPPDPSVLQAIILGSVESYKFDLLGVDLLGRIYEEYLSYEVKYDIHGLFYEIQMERRKQQGVYYTPSPIVEYLVGRAVRLFENTNSRPVSSALDMASGSGIFLTTLVEELLRRHPAATLSEKRSLVERTIYGIDVDEHAVRRSAQAIYFSLLEGSGMLTGRHLLPRLLGSNLLVKDALAERGRLIGERQLDVIASNPPYLRISGDQLAPYRDQYADVIYNQSDLCWLMLVAAIDNLSDGGVVAFIVPDNILRTAEYSRLRRYILDKTRIIEVSYLNYQAFESASLQNILLILQRDALPERRRANIVRVNYYATPGVFDLDTSEAPAQITQADFDNEDLDYTFNVHLTASVRAVYEKIREKSEPLSAHFLVGQGIKPDRSKLYEAPIQPDAKRYLLGKDIRPYAVRWTGTYYDYDPQEVPSDPNVRLRDPQAFESPAKLIVRKIVADLLVVALDVEQYYVDSSAYIVWPAKPTADGVETAAGDTTVVDDILYLALAVLTSPLAKFYYQVEYPERKVTFPQIRGRDIERLPLPNPTLRKDAAVTVAAIVAEAKALYARVTSGDVEGLDVYKADEVHRIDGLLANLYGLTDAERYLMDVYRSGSHA